MKHKEIKIAVLGLGYVGLPLALELSSKFNVLGFDINESRVDEISSGFDQTKEVDEKILKERIKSEKLIVSCKKAELKKSNFYIITVPTPIDSNNNPNLKPVESATRIVADFLSEGDIVVYESTVYPGLTEEFCIPLLEKISNLKLNQDFSVGYSPERINPGDKIHTLTKINKVISASNSKSLETIDYVYSSIITAGTFRASSIKVAEAAKVIENSQRDINIAFVNELSIIFEKLNIDTNEVLDAASTKWNFLNFKPGLVGGHCIGVDPYYLAQKSINSGYIPEILLSGRRLNNGMGAFISNKAVKLMINKSLKIKNARAIILGITFKENCPDIRNTRVIDIYNELNAYGLKIDVCDPNASEEEVMYEYGIKIKDLNLIKLSDYSLIVIAVNHNQFKNLKIEKSSENVIIDVKSMFNKDKSDYRL